MICKTNVVAGTKTCVHNLRSSILKGVVGLQEYVFDRGSQVLYFFLLSECLFRFVTT